MIWPVKDKTLYILYWVNYSVTVDRADLKGEPNPIYSNKPENLPITLTS